MVRTFTTAGLECGHEVYRNAKTIPVGKRVFCTNPDCMQMRVVIAVPAYRARGPAIDSLFRNQQEMRDNDSGPEQPTLPGM